MPGGTRVIKRSKKYLTLLFSYDVDDDYSDMSNSLMLNIISTIQSFNQSNSTYLSRPQYHLEKMFTSDSKPEISESNIITTKEDLDNI